jgi:hypothetical protein
VTVAEVLSEGSRVVDDLDCPSPDGKPWPVGHVYLDQRLQEDWRREQLKLNLAGVATHRKRLYPPSEMSD